MAYARRASTLRLATFATLSTLASLSTVTGTATAVTGTVARSAPAPAPASASASVPMAVAGQAATTTVRQGDATAEPYSGAVKVSLLGVATASTSFGTGTCNRSEMSARVASDGTGLVVTAASFGNEPGPDCPATNGTAVAITPENLPWGTGVVTYAPVSGGRDGTVTIAGFRVKVVTKNLPVLGSITCYYGGSITIDAFNPDNPSRPDPSLNEAQAQASNITINRVSGGSIYCPSTATASATYALTGESAPGVFDQTLYLTG